MLNVTNSVRPDIPGRTGLPVSKQPIREKNNSPRMLYCEVVFGSPSADCRGTGICKITGTNGFSLDSLKRDCKITSACITGRPDGGGVSLFFFRSFLCIRLYRHHFHKGIFQMQESCALPTEMTGGLDIQAKELLAGNYPIIECEGYCRVDVDCA